LVILSTSPYESQKAHGILMKKVRYFNLENIFDEVHATKEIPSSKGEFIEEILKKNSIPKKSALMVGDSYKWDYNSAISKGIDAVLIKTKYENQIIKEEHIIKNINEMLTML
jgi:FMN phosphatase YigB (HAD superfamily)